MRFIKRELLVVLLFLFFNSCDLLVPQSIDGTVWQRTWYNEYTNTYDTFRVDFTTKTNGSALIPDGGGLVSFTYVWNGYLKEGTITLQIPTENGVENYDIDFIMSSDDESITLSTYDIWEIDTILFRTTT